MNVRANIEFSERSCQRGGALLVLALPSTPTAILSRPIITLASLSMAIPDQWIGNALAQFTHSETDASVLLVQMDNASPTVSLREFGAIQATLNGEFCFAEHLRSGEGGFKRLNLRMTGEP